MALHILTENCHASRDVRTAVAIDQAAFATFIGCHFSVVADGSKFQHL